MASATLTRPATPTPPTSFRAPYRQATPPKPRWPGSTEGRLAVRLLLALPLAFLAARAGSHGFHDLSNEALVRRSAVINWGTDDLGFVRHLYPPIPTALASMLPANAIWLGLLGAIFGGVILHAAAERLVQNGYPMWSVVVLVGSVALTPSFVLTTTSDFQSFVAVALCIVAIDGFLSFALLGNTHGGFRAGLALGLAAACDPSAVFFAVFLAAVAPLVGGPRFRAKPQAARAAAAVLLFPTVAGLAGWIFLQWRFTGSPLGWLREVAPDVFFHAGVWSQLSAAAHELALPLLVSPLFFVSAYLLARGRNRWAAVGYLLLIPSMLLTVWVGLPMSRPMIAILLAAMAIVGLPARPRRGLVIAVSVVAVAQLTVRWGFGVHSPLVQHWLHAVL